MHLSVFFAAVNFSFGFLGWLILQLFGAAIGVLIGWIVGYNGRGTKGPYLLAGSIGGFVGPFVLGLLFGFFFDAQVSLIGSYWIALVGAILGAFAVSWRLRVTRKQTPLAGLPPQYSQYTAQQGTPVYPPQWVQPPYPQAQPQPPQWSSAPVSWSYPVQGSAPVYPPQSQPQSPYPTQSSPYLPPQQWSSPSGRPEGFGAATVLPGGRMAELHFRWEDTDGPHEATLTGVAPVVIGRQAGSDIHLVSEHVSPSHALVRRRNDAFVISDLTEGHNVTVLNGSRVVGEVPLSTGDQMMLGDVILAVTAIIDPDRG